MAQEIPNIPRRRGKTNKPKDTAWLQQRLSSARPQYTINVVLPFALLLGFALLGLGIAMYFGADHSLEVNIDYTDCMTSNGSAAATVLADGNKTVVKPQCTFHLNLTRDFTGDVKFYYGLTGFYQNFRQYLSSRNDLQLVGNIDSTSGCSPLDTDKETGFPIVPCGFIANSMFNDTFKLYFDVHRNGTFRQPVRITKRNVISHREQTHKFKNPPVKTNQTLCQADALVNTTKPPWWPNPICKLGINEDAEMDSGIGFENVDFMVWMKPAALPNFRKPYGFVDREVDPFQDGLPAGDYTLIISYNYPVHTFEGNKSFIIARESWVGPRRFFIPVTLMITGVFIILAFTGLFLLVLFRNRYLKRA